MAQFWHRHGTGLREFNHIPGITMAQPWHSPGMTMARFWHREQHTRAPAQRSCPSSAPLQAIQNPGFHWEEPTYPWTALSQCKSQLSTAGHGHREGTNPRGWWLWEGQRRLRARPHHGVAKELCLTPESGCQMCRSRAGMLSDPGAPNKSRLQGLCLKRRLIGVIMGARSALAGKVYKGKLK